MAGALEGRWVTGGLEQGSTSDMAGIRGRDVLERGHPAFQVFDAIPCHPLHAGFKKKSVFESGFALTPRPCSWETKSHHHGHLLTGHS